MPAVSAFFSDHSLPGKLLTSRGRSTALFYFDDVSRDHTFGWTPKGHCGQGESDGTSIGTGMAKEKTDAMQRRLFGHDLESASVLSDAQVEDETRQWIQDTGLVASSEEATLAKSIYGGGLLGLETHNSSSLVGCLASAWRSIVAFIDENADEYYPTDIWETDNMEHGQLFLQIFPRCEALYDYDTLKLMGSAMEFCQNSCTHYGKRFNVVLFHPRYEHAPKMIYPEHHSPFPSMGLHVLGESEAVATNDDQEDEIVRIGEPEEKAESITSSDIADFVPKLSEKKRSLERLFNSPAAVSSVTDSRSFGHTYQELSEEDIIAASKHWIKDQQSENSSPLKHMETAIDKTIKVSDATIAEQAYADIWEEISSLYDAGKIIDDEKDSNLHGSVVSSLFIARTYSSYNASEFKQFAITVNAALKHLTDGKMFLELFHPEYVASRAGAQHSNRRSPYPMIQICYRARQ